MTSPGHWRLAAASAIGTSHTKQNLPCQDDWGARLLRDAAGGDVLVTVVSDGAGSAACAEQGSRLACALALAAVAAYVDAGGLVGDIDEGMARDWIGRIRHGITAEAEADGRVPRDYACTCLIAVVGGDAAAILQIGDGAVVVSQGVEDGWCWVHWPQHGEFANTTNFVTDPAAEERLAFDLCRRRIDEIALFSDGIERLVLHEATRTVFAPFFDQMFPPVRKSTVQGFDAGLSANLERYLGSPTVCHKTDDDKTLVLASRRAAGAVPVVDEHAVSAAEEGPSSTA